MSFENNIQQWLLADNQLKNLNEKVKILRETRNALTENITNYAEENNLSNSLIHVNDGKLKIINTKVQSPLTYKYLEKSLGEIIRNENQVKLIVEHLKQKRDTKIISEIKRFYNV
jgi:hypothetical protein